MARKRITLTLVLEDEDEVEARVLDMYQALPDNSYRRPEFLRRLMTVGYLSLYRQDDRAFVDDLVARGVFGPVPAMAPAPVVAPVVARPPVAPVLRPAVVHREPEPEPAPVQATESPPDDTGDLSSSELGISPASRNNLKQLLGKHG